MTGDVTSVTATVTTVTTVTTAEFCGFPAFNLSVGASVRRFQSPPHGFQRAQMEDKQVPGVPEYVDGGILKKEIYPASRTTVWRLIQRKDDPFPAGFLIGGKRYWESSEVLDWLARQKAKAA